MRLHDKDLLPPGPHPKSVIVNVIEIIVKCSLDDLWGLLYKVQELRGGKNFFLRQICMCVSTDGYDSRTSNFLFNFAVQCRTLFFEPFQRPLWICRDLTLGNDRLSNLFIRNSPSVRFKVCSRSLYCMLRAPGKK